METSILKSTKKILGYELDNSFDLDVITHINSSFFRLNTLGIGPPAGFVIEGEAEKWEDFNTMGLNASVLMAVKTYIYSKVRLGFDPPGTPHHLQALKDQIAELEYVMLTERNLIHADS
jgi:hypothetical protein